MELSLNIHERKGYDILANKGPDQHIFLYRVDQGTLLPIYGTLSVGSSVRFMWAEMRENLSSGFWTK